LEKHLGHTLGSAKDVDRPRIVSAALVKKYGADSVLRRTDVQKSAAYINVRCDGLNGRTILYALQHYKYSYEGHLIDYKTADLEYDLGGGSLRVEKRGTSSTTSRPTVKTFARSRTIAQTLVKQTSTKQFVKGVVAAPSSSPVVGKRGTSSSSQFRNKSSQKSTCNGDQPQDQKQVKDKGTHQTSQVPLRTEIPNATGSDQPNIPKSQRFFYKEVFETALMPAKTSQVSTIQIAALIGVGAALKLHSSLMIALQDVLAKRPDERGHADNYVIRSFEAELLKYCQDS
jgi:hypothetical protein